MKSRHYIIKLTYQEVDLLEKVLYQFKIVSSVNTKATKAMERVRKKALRHIKSK